MPEPRKIKLVRAPIFDEYEYKRLCFEKERYMKVLLEYMKPKVTLALHNPLLKKHRGDIDEQYNFLILLLLDTGGLLEEAKRKQDGDILIKVKDRLKNFSKRIDDLENEIERLKQSNYEIEQAKKDVMSTLRKVFAEAYKIQKSLKSIKIQSLLKAARPVIEEAEELIKALPSGDMIERMICYQPEKAKDTFKRWSKDYLRRLNNLYVNAKPILNAEKRQSRSAIEIMSSTNEPTQSVTITKNGEGNRYASLVNESPAKQVAKELYAEKNNRYASIMAKDDPIRQMSVAQLEKEIKKSPRFASILKAKPNVRSKMIASELKRRANMLRSFKAKTATFNRKYRPAVQNESARFSSMVNEMGGAKGSRSNAVQNESARFASLWDAMPKSLRRKRSNLGALFGWIY